MTDNPYQSPGVVGESSDAESSVRREARRWFHSAVGILFLPAVYNYWAFDAYAVGRLHEDIASLYRVVNMLGLGIVAALIWYLGLPCLEAIAQCLRIVFARSADREAWDETLYRSLRTVVYLVVPGAVLWIIWVFGVYQMHGDFYAMSWAIGIPAHLLGACWYVPLAYRWYRLAVSKADYRLPEK